MPVRGYGSRAAAFWGECRGLITTGLRRRRHVERRVTVEDAEGLQPARHGIRRHDGPVLGPSDVMDAEHVPEDHVGAGNGPVRGGPLCKPGIFGAEVREVARRPALAI